MLFGLIFAEMVDKTAGNVLGYGSKIMDLEGGEQNDNS